MKRKNRRDRAKRIAAMIIAGIIVLAMALGVVLPMLVMK